MKKLKLLVLGIDALIPEVIFNNLDILPNFKKLCEAGASGSYDGYVYGYGSYDNWVSIYTGLTPKEHGIIGNGVKETGERPTPAYYADKKPFWKVLNDAGISTGLWRLDVGSPPAEVDGYMIGGEYTHESIGDPYASWEPLFNSKDMHLKELLEGEPAYPIYPKKPEDYGYKFEDFFKNSEPVSDILTETYFEESLMYLEGDLEYYFRNNVKFQKEVPTDVIFRYTAVTDFIGHFLMADPERKVLKKAYQIVDRYIGKYIESLQPENIIVLSDHGLQSFAGFLPNTPPEIQREAFGWRDRSIWLKNGQIVSTSRVGGFFTAAHWIKGFFGAMGKDIKNTKLFDMRTVDIYPILLELFDIKVPEGRSGFIPDIMNKEYTNYDRVLKADKVERKKIALIQNLDVNLFNGIINEAFQANRFAKFTLYGEDKYRNIFMGNPIVSEFIAISDMSLNKDELAKYDKVITGYRNEYLNKVIPLEIA